MGKVAEFLHLFTESLKPAAPVTRCRFVDAAGALIGVLGARSHGVSIDSATAEDIAAGRTMGVCVIGLVELEAGGPVPVGSKVTSDASGRGVVAGVGNKVNAIARSKADAAGDRFSALLIFTSDTP